MRAHAELGRGVLPEVQRSGVPRAGDGARAACLEGLTVDATALLTADQVAELLAVHPRTVYELCAAGRLAHYRVGVGGGAIRITREAVEAYLAASLVPASDEAPARPKVRRPAAPARQPLRVAPRHLRPPP